MRIELLFASKLSVTYRHIRYGYGMGLININVGLGFVKP